MKFTCDHCQRLYSIPDDRIRGKTVKVRCKNCQRVITVTWKESAAEIAPEDEQTRSVSINELMTMQGGSSWETEPTRALPGPTPGVPWFAMVQGVQEGPLTVAQLSERIRRDEVTLRTYVWRQGRKEWQRAADVAELIPLFAGSPPGRESTPAPAKRKPEVHRRGNEAPVAAPPKEKASDGKALEALFSDLNEQRKEAPEAAPLVLKRKRVAEPTSQPPVRAERTELVPESVTHPGAAQTSTSDDLPFAAPNEPFPAHEPPPLDLRQTRASTEPAFQSAAERPAPRPIATPPPPPEVEHSGDEVEDSSILPDVPVDPFAALSEGDGIEAPPVGEATAFFIAQAGVNRRNPPWKIALTVLVFLAVPVSLLYMLSRLNVAPVQITQRDAAGNEITRSVSVFSPAGVSGLKDLLLGNTHPATHSAPPRRIPSRSASASATTNAFNGGPSTVVPPAPDRRPIDGASGPRRMYNSLSKEDVGLPDMHGGAPTQPAQSNDASGGPPPAELKRIVEQTQPAFQFCIEQYVRKHPTFRGGRVNLVATVGPSGIVKKSAVDRADIESSELGACLKTKARRMVFSSFSGDDVDLQIPLILTTSL